MGINANMMMIPKPIITPLTISEDPNFALRVTDLHLYRS
jgi:hypothetical protein